MLRRLEELFKQKEWVQLKREAEALLRLPDLDDYSLGRIYRYLGRAAFGLRQFDLAAGYLEVGIPYSTRSSDWDGIGFMQLDLSGTHIILGNRHEARRSLEEFLLHLPRYTEARRHEGKAHYNLGWVYWQDRQYPLALAAYKQALRCFLDRQPMRDVADTHQNIAWLLLLLGNAQEAKKHIQTASMYQEAPQDFATEQLILYAFNHCVAGDQDTAMGYLAPVLEGRAEVSEAHKACARWVAAQLRLHSKDLTGAKRLVHEALNIALAAKETHLVVLCVELEAKIREAVGEGAVEPTQVSEMP